MSPIWQNRLPANNDTGSIGAIGVYRSCFFRRRVEAAGKIDKKVTPQDGVTFL